jgi:hypothetical protein
MAMRIFWRLLGLCFLVLPFLPLRTLFEENRAVQGLVPAQAWLLGAVIVCALAWLLCLLIPQSLFGRVWGVLACKEQSPGWRFPAAFLGIIALELLLISLVAFKTRYHLIDSVAQLFQAYIFASGHLSAAINRPIGFFLVQNMVVEAARWYSQYPPGHAALLALGVLTGAAWIVPIVLSCAMALLLYFFTLRIYGLGPARVLLVLLCCCPFFLFMGASYMNHVSSAFFLALFLFAFVHWEGSQQRKWLVLSGAALGMVFLIRPLSCLACGLVFFPVAAVDALERKRLFGCLPGFFAFIAVACGYFVFNLLTTGNALVSGYVELWGRGHGLGFHATPWGEMHTPFIGLGQELGDLALLNEYLFEWPLPALMPLALFLVLAKEMAKWDKRLCWAFLAIPGAYFFYWHRDGFLGPRFIFCGVVFLLPLTASVIYRALSEPGSMVVKVPGLFNPVAVSQFLGVLFTLCLLYSVCFSIPQRFLIYQSNLASMKTDIAGLARSARVSNAIVFVPVSWGNRIIAGLRELGVPAPLVEQAYRTVDHCLLHQVLVQARQKRESRESIESQLAEMIGEKQLLVKKNLSGDPSLRLRPNLSLAPACAEELRYDQLGYLDYTAHLLENNPAFEGDIVVARDLRERNAELIRYYPGKKAYLFRNGSFLELAQAGDDL